MSVIVLDTMAQVIHGTLTLADVLDIIRRLVSLRVLNFDIQRSNELTSKPEEVRSHDRNDLLRDLLPLLAVAFQVRSF